MTITDERLRTLSDATIDRASEQLVRTDAITARMDEVTANMAELTGRVTALAPLARMIAGSAGSPLAKAAALAYGVNRALWMRRPGGGDGGSRLPAARAKIFGRNAARVYGIDADEVRRALEWDDTARAKAAYLEAPEPSFRTRGPRSRRELFALTRANRGLP